MNVLMLDNVVHIYLGRESKDLERLLNNERFTGKVASHRDSTSLGVGYEVYLDSSLRDLHNLGITPPGAPPYKAEAVTIGLSRKALECVRKVGTYQAGDGPNVLRVKA